MKRQIGLMLLLAVSYYCTSQQIIKDCKPKVWLKSENFESSIDKWIDSSPNHKNATLMQNGNSPSLTAFNYHPSLQFDSSTSPFRIFYNPRSNEKLLIFSVFSPTQAEKESGVWNIQLDSNLNIKLSTQKLKSLYKYIQYADSTKQLATINSLSQSWKNKHIDSSISCISIAGTDSFAFQGKFAEFILCDTNLSYPNKVKLHTYLAIKYGISLRDMNYISYCDTVIWNYQKNIDYKYDIASIGRDTLLGIYQKQSSGNGGESPVTISANSIYSSNLANPSFIEQDDFIIWGNNGNNIQEIEEDSGNNVGFLSKSKWLLNTSGLSSNSISTQLMFNSNEIRGVERIALVINRASDITFPIQSSEIIFADSADIYGNYYFNNIFWDTDNSKSDVFGFQIIKSSKRTKNSSNQKDKNAEVVEAIISCNLFPNPADHQYLLSLELSKEMKVQVTIQDPSGKIIEKIQKSGASNYSINGYLKDTGCYLITVQTEKQTKTYKLIVR